MCDPISGAGLALGLGGRVLGFMGDSARSRANAANAKQAYMLDMMMLAKRMQQERTQSAVKVLQMNKEANQVVAQTQVNAAEMGLSGNTIEQLINNTKMQNDERVLITRQNSDAVVDQLGMETLGAGARMRERINSIPAPSLAGLLIGGLSDGLGAFNTHNRLLRMNGD